MTDHPADDEERSPFVTWLEEQRQGALLIELDQAFLDLNLDVANIGKAGTLTLTVKVEQKGATLVVVDDVKAKPPRPDRGADIFFTDAKGELHRQDPAQQRLNLSAVLPIGERLRVVNHDTGEVDYDDADEPEGQE